MRAFFFGAGSSAGTLETWPERPPVSTKFGETLGERYALWEREYPGLAEVVRHLGRPIEQLSLEDVWTHIDYWAKLGAILPSQPQWNPAAVWDLKRVLLRLYGGSCDRAASQIPLSDVFTLGDLFSRQIKPGDVLVSFNYDTIVERLAGRYGHTLIPPGAKADPRALVLAKPHGSASWRMDWRNRRVLWTELDNKVAASSMEESDVGRDQEPLLLGAVPIKSELVREVQRTYFPDVWDVVTAQWQVALRAIRDADALVFVGYGFPSEDHYGCFLFKQAARSRGVGAPLAVEFYELPDRVSCVQTAIVDALGLSDVIPEPKGKVTPAPCTAQPAG